MSGALSVLSRIRATRPAARTLEQCELCSTALADEHGHVVDVRSRAMMCACRPCYLLFTAETAELGRRAVPDRVVAFPALPAQVWDRLEIPVGTAFLFHSSATGAMVAIYPGPAGATESELPLAAWDGVLAELPALMSMRPDVEALLVRPVAGRVEALLVPIDTCYALVGQLRQHWRGFDGGQHVHALVDGVFHQLRTRAGLS